MPRWSPVHAVPFRARWLSLPLLLGLILWWQGAPPAGAQATDGAVHLVQIQGVISPTQARFLTRELDYAAAAQSHLVIIQLDTPGGLDSAMREISSAILGASVPVAVWVGPPGARAASAGLFITLAAPFAAMAHGTTIGAAHPVRLGGRDLGDSDLTEKVVADAAAYARSLATVHGRNAELAARSVTESLASSAEEALAENLIDALADDLPALLQALDGRTLATAAGPMELSPAGRDVVARHLSWVERIVQVATDPNIAYILFTVGILGLLAELYNPGMVVPGGVGFTSLLLAFVAFGSLPVSGAGIALLVLGVALLLADLYTEGLGVLAAAGLGIFVVGSILLYRPLGAPSPAQPDLALSPGIVVAVVAILAVFFLIVLRALLQARKEPIATGPAALVGQTGVALTELKPWGRVQIDGEDWRGEALDGAIPAGTPVLVHQVEGVTLRVLPA